MKNKSFPVKRNGLFTSKEHSAKERLNTSATLRATSIFEAGVVQ
jgi:hypothetical protein